jgi:SEC-C motif/HNH endonuclease
MAQRRASITKRQKEQLVREAGGKCANPGCSAWRTHLHHIREWAVYKADDAEHMIAICPTCHDAVHNGALPISDGTLYAWKSIERSRPPTDNVFVEPGDSSKLLLGSLAVTGQGGVTVFELGSSNRLSFRLVDEDIMHLNLAVATTGGQEVLRIVDGHVRHEAAEPLQYARTPGHIRLTAPASEEYMPAWALGQIRLHEPEFAADGRLTLSDVEVLEPGLVRVQGIWNGPGHVVAITTERLAFLDPNRTGPLALTGAGAESILHFTGPITTALFTVGDESGALHIPATRGPKTGRNDPCPCGSGLKFKKCHGS